MQLECINMQKLLPPFSFRRTLTTLRLPTNRCLSTLPLLRWEPLWLDLEVKIKCTLCVQQEYILFHGFSRWLYNERVLPPSSGHLLPLRDKYFDIWRTDLHTIRRSPPNAWYIRNTFIRLGKGLITRSHSRTSCFKKYVCKPTIPGSNWHFRLK